MFGGAVVVCYVWLTKTNCGNSNNKLAIYNMDSNTGSGCFLVNLIKLTPGYDCILFSVARLNFDKLRKHIHHSICDCRFDWAQWAVGRGNVENDKKTRTSFPYQMVGGIRTCSLSKNNKVKKEISCMYVCIDYQS